MSKKKKSTTESESKKQTPVAFIEDPFAIRTLDIAEVQQSSEEIDEGFDAVDLAVAEKDIQAPKQEAKKPARSRIAKAALAAAPFAPISSPASAATTTENQTDSESNEALSLADDQEVTSAPADETEFMKLAESIADQVASDQAEALAGLPEQDPEALAALELAAQIAEDQALQAQEAEEAKRAEELDPELKAALPQPDENGNLDLEEVQSCLEAILFISDKPMSLKRLHELLGPDFSHGIFQEAVTALKDRYQSSPHHGIELVEVAGGYQFRTRPGRAALARKLARVQTQRLSSGAMESLAIIAYKQPAMKDDIDKIRGVDSSYFIRGLLDRKLIRISGRSEMPGRPMLYSTTDEFLELFGMKDLNALPPLQELEAMVPAQAAKEEEDPRVKQMRKLVNEMTTDTSTTLTYDPREDEIILKEMKERIGSIPVSTPYLDEQKAAEKAAKNPAKSIELAEIQPELGAALSSVEPSVENTPSAPEDDVSAEDLQQASLVSVADQMASEMVSQSMESGEPLPSELVGEGSVDSDDANR
jgi:segregation and condensation protein B